MQLSDRIGRRLKLQDLHILTVVVQSGSMGKAAALLNTGQSAVSRSIGELEHVLGVRLLDRSPRGVEPTAYGRALLSGGAAVFDELRQTVKNIEFLADPTSGEVRIGSVTPLATSFIASIVDRLSRRYPHITFRVLNNSTDELHRELSERNVDLLIARRLGSFPDERMNFEVLFDDSFAIVAGAQSPLARRRKIELAELVNESWALPAPESAFGLMIAEAFRSRGLDHPRTVLITGPVDMRIDLVGTGRFLSIFSRSLLRFPSWAAKLKVLPVDLPMAAAPLGIVTLKNRTLNPVAQLFIDTAREIAEPLAKKPR